MISMNSLYFCGSLEVCSSTMPTVNHVSCILYSLPSTSTQTEPGQQCSLAVHFLPQHGSSSSCNSWNTSAGLSRCSKITSPYVTAHYMSYPLSNKIQKPKKHWITSIGVRTRKKVLKQVWRYSFVNLCSRQTFKFRDIGVIGLLLVVFFPHKLFTQLLYCITRQSRYVHTYCKENG